MKIKRIAAALVAAVMVIMTMAMTVSAESIFKTAKNADSGKKISTTIGYDGSDGKTAAYKFTPAAKGTAKIKITAEAHEFSFYIYDEDGNEVEYKRDVSMGKNNNWHPEIYEWNKDAETFKATFTFSVAAKKTYYIQIVRPRSYASNKGTGKYEISFSYPTETKAADDTLLTYTLKKGKTIQFGATASNAKWSTSDKSVATVSSKGLIKGVKKGEAVITLKGGSQTVKIKIIVTA